MSLCILPRRIPLPRNHHRISLTAPPLHPRFYRTAQIQVSSNTNEEETARGIEPLLLANGGKWAIGDDNKSLERVFKFGGFKKTWGFMKRIAEHCDEERHHPEWLNVYNKVSIRWTTHRPPGLSHKDLKMALFCDRLATEMGDMADVGEQLEHVPFRMKVPLQGTMSPLKEEKPVGDQSISSS